MLTQEREFDSPDSDHFNTVPMSKFNPAAWLNRSGLFSDSSADVSTNESLAGVNYASQSSLGSAQINAGGENPSLAATAAGLSNRRAPASNNDLHHQLKGNELLRQWKYDESHSLREDTGNSDKLHEQPSSPPSPSQHIRQMSMPIISSSGAIRSTSQNRRPGFSDYQESNPYPAIQSNAGSHYTNNFSIEVQSDDDDSLPYPGTHDGLNRNESFGAASCISGLSADETHFDDGRSYRRNGDTNRVHPLLHPRDTRALPAPKGRDFGDAFDHLILDGQSNDEADNCYRTTNSTGSRRVYPNKNTVRPKHMRVQSNLEYRSNSHPLTKPKHLPAHATLRERITIVKPQILQSRSTSNTVHSSSSTSQSAASYVRHCATGRPIENIKIGGRSSSISSNVGGHSDIDGYHDELALNPGLRRHNELLGNRPRHNVHSQSTNRTLDGYDEKSLQDVPEDDPSTKWNDAKSIDGRSVLSNASTTQRRRVIKDEIKFIVTKFVPARLRKGRNGSITLERSEGCLT